MKDSNTDGPLGLRMPAQASQVGPTPMRARFAALRQCARFAAFRQRARTAPASSESGPGLVGTWPPPRRKGGQSEAARCLFA